MRCIALLSSLVLVLAVPAGSSRAQGNGPAAAGPASRIVVSLELSAALVSRRVQSEWMDAIPRPLLEEMQADEHFASIELGGTAGNGVLIRFDFDDMESYKEWNGRPEVQQMLAKIEQAIGYGYSRSALSMRRVAADTRAMPAAPPRRPPPAKPAPVPKVTTRAAVRSS